MSSGSKINFHRSVRFDRWCYFTARGGEIFIDENTFLNTQVILNADVGGKIFISKKKLDKLKEQIAYNKIPVNLVFEKAQEVLLN
jgi:hypothetical protein